ncbi:hypothetical protein FSB76_05920 [Mucilaginibacter ginsenosidivorax]|uniref:Uncharacterized protein n=2 Tax=Mucilaginibacter ginsenosidivorax TaxID=862126 RepID=A0A5B8VW47_9SPHI|nr:hypothetical protein FSB76_05920 [Mucilaginibacter ginsenosidivorax]
MKSLAKYTLITLILITAAMSCLAQEDYLEKGNTFLDKGQLSKAERAFRDGIKADPTNLIYQCQLGLTLIQQKKFAASEIVLQQVLKNDSNNVAARWYSGIGYFENTQDRKSVNEFLKALPLIDKQSGQYYSANWYIGKCYANLLKTEGLTYAETDQMFASYQEYLRLQPDAEDAATIKAYIEHKKARRPPANVKIWVDL